MTRFFRSTRYYGNRTFIEDEPGVVRLLDHVFNPIPSLGYPGIYDYGRKLVHQSGYSRGPNPAEVLPSLQPNFFYDDVTEWADDPSYFYLGQLHPHFGHFLLSTFSRLWNIHDFPGLKILYLSSTSLTESIKPFMRVLFDALEIDEARFVTFSHPVKVREIILPYASFEEQNFAHRTFATFCNAVGDRLTKSLAPRAPTDKPVYLSKQRIQHGVRRIINESEICEQLEKQGFDIEFPEELAFVDQVALWRSRRLITSFSASALHTSIFAQRPRLVCFNYDDHINSSFALCDRANGTTSDYFHFEHDAFDDLGPSLNFVAERQGMSSELCARNPQAIADNIIRSVDLVRQKEARSLHESLSLGRPTSQSSSSHEAEASGSSAVNGVITGKYQFHTIYEEEPWWQVDLQRECEIYEIDVFNRTDAAPERSALVHIATSADGAVFDNVYVRTEEEAFGGLNGEPLLLKFEKPCRGRYVRFSIPGPEFFHLDQVEIRGRPALTTKENS